MFRKSRRDNSSLSGNGPLPKGRNQHKEQSLAEWFKVLREISVAMTSGRDLGGILKQIIEEALSVLPVDLIAVFVMNEEKRSLEAMVASTSLGEEGVRRLEEAYGAPFSEVNFPLKRGRALIVDAVLRRKPRFGLDLAWLKRITRYGGVRPLLEAVEEMFGARTVSMVPLIARERPEGVMVFLGPERMTPSEEDLMAAFASQAAVVIENARLYEMVKSERDKLTAIISGIDDGVDVVGKDYMVKFQNQMLVERFGDLTGQLCYEGYMGLEEPCEVCPMVKAIETGVPHRAELVGKDGRDYEITSVPLPNPDGTVDAIEIARDITERKRAEEALRGSEEKLRAQYKGIPVPTYTWQRVGEEFVLVDYNDAAEAITHGNIISFVGRKASEMYQHRPDIVEELSRCYAQKASIKREMEYQFMITGERKDLEVTYAFVPPDLVMIHTEDITERKRVEEARRRQAEQVEALREIGLELTAQLDLDTLLRSIVSRAVELLGGTAGGLYLYRPERDLLEWAVASESSLAPIGSVLQRGEGLSGKVWETGEPLIVNDYQRWQGRAAIYEGYPFTAVVGVPVRWGEKFLGVLNVLADAPRTFSPADAQLLSLFANQVAVAMTNATLYEERSRRAEELAALYDVSLDLAAQLDLDTLLETILLRAMELLRANMGGLYLYDPEREELELVVAEGLSKDYRGIRLALGEGACGRVAVSKEPLVVRDYTNWEGRSPHFDDEPTFNVLAVPIKRGDTLLGALYVDDPHVERRFEEGDVRLATLLANQAAIAIENARLYEEERHRGLQRKTIAEVGRTIASILDLDTLLSRVVDLIAQNFGYYFVHVFEVDADAGYAVFKAGTGEAGRILKEEMVRLRIGDEGIVGWVAHSGEPLMANDVKNEPRYYFHPALPDTRSELAVPIQLGGKVIGVLDVESEQLNAFDESDLATLETLAGQLAVAMENARLYEEERRRAQELSILLDTAQTLASSLDLKQVLETIASQAKELTQADGSRIYLLEPDEKTLKPFIVLEDYAEEIMATPVPVGQGITGYVVLTGIAEIVNHAERDPRAVQIPGTPEEAQCLMCTPLVVKGEVIGVMTLSREGDKEFQDSDLRLLTSLASQAATAIENARLYEETKRLAATDPLTGVWNRRHIGERLRTEVARTRRFGHELSVLVMDIDDLKLFNDAYGHAAGDKVIRTVAQAVLASCREIDIVGRYGGDEFALILPEAGASGAGTVAERILAALEKEPFKAPDGTKVPISMSIGAASFPTDSDDAERLFSLADAAMYRAKMAGGGQFASLAAGPEEVAEELVGRFDVLQGLLIAVDTKDRYTFKHSQEVTKRALALAQAVGVSPEEIKALEVAGRFHDVGKIGIPTNVLRKPGVLTEEAWEIVRLHPRLGYLILQQIPLMETALEVVLHHHEQYDGTGYPDGLQGEKIPLLARILAVADAFSAMMTDRPYRQALTVEEALEELRHNAGKQFDPVLAEKFIELVEKGEID